ncbi:YggS family pyridoxal phosphate-dependent enzyme [Clostridium algidicarnis]|uniref:Pyridoxal phosphate homeostasis protein n=2 Tax=Clostridium algidicarnis TaxID=37659 RepID=A0A2S6G1S5_9CLOT|nr:YggS family pyridoxal phosphate-dependent enzyme [Clostridium algidicarnis]MBB6697637.1 YggS family pyridoxal phosphate-dependent enzyme [Clostridium algidicarnis]MBU3203275.1 YggS family pyridoxal phosphate-dependent enzyme [Clostridium algidicarnis]MBU3205430.1 YggS family pyridoxal phosphate-dependent enzyme [Clostridium algidicarnis]MBU3211429.1 YggS family pyridoxal phosphate-dependent enzyme [Clostridium algidicarnis]MBU3219868.1 YggS family pyridoxal phosphate-dependent enzyme [Clost
MDVLGNLKSITNEIPKDSTFIAVSKQQSTDSIKKAYDFGIIDFGENKVQELLEKSEELPKDIRWHFIGHLQRNKVKYIVGKVYLIQSLDSIRLLSEIEKQYMKQNKVAEALIEINIGKEKSKDGIFLEDLEELIVEIEKCNFVKIKGLMAIIPKGDEKSSESYFMKMKDIWDNLSYRKFSNISMDYLSMGMSRDYELALKCGANMIRVGEGIFGKRI